ncbi:hypothetical protein VU04_04075 [Desulfobulbus sp. TB]|nr:hypothetical protein [Desulfobulbus sp. TB]
MKMKNIVLFKNAKDNLALTLAVAFIILGFANSAIANHFLEVRVWKFNYLSSPTYHSDVTFNTNTPYLAFGPDGVTEYSIPGKIVWTKRFYTGIPYDPDGTKRFWQIKEELESEWNRYSYNLANRNCNHFVDAVLRRYRAGNLPGGYFSRGDHLDKQVWNWAAQGAGLSQEEADRLGKKWAKTRGSVTDSVRKAGRDIDKALNPARW